MDLQYSTASHVNTTALRAMLLFDSHNVAAKIFGNLRVEFDDLKLMKYDLEDELYNLLNKAELILTERLGER